MSYFISELKRGIASKSFIFSIFLTLVTLAVGAVTSWSSIATIKGASFFLYAFSLGTGAILPVLAPLLASFSFAHSFIEDIEHNMFYGILSRTTLKHYYLSKCLSIGSLAALSFFISLSLFLTINHFLFPLDHSVYIGEISGPWSSLFKKHQVLYCLMTIFNSALFAFVYGNIGFVATLFKPKRLVAIAVPFLLYILPSFIFPFFSLDLFEPVNTFDLTANTTSTLLTVYGQLGLVLTTCMFIGYHRIHQELLGYGT